MDRNIDELPLFGPKINRTFSDIYPDEATFVKDVTESKLPVDLTQDEIKTTYYLMYGKYGDTEIINTNEFRWKYRLFTVMREHGPAWSARSNVQGKIRELLKSGNESDLLTAAKTISNSSVHPDTTLKTSDEELKKIHAQNVGTRKMGKMTAYSIIFGLINENYTDVYLSKFSGLFKTMFAPYGNLLYWECD